MPTPSPKASQRTIPYRVPPQNVEAEQCVLGGALIEDGALAKVIEHLSPEDFYRENHRHIYSAMLDLFDRGEPLDLITVHNALKTKGVLEKAGGTAYLAELTEVVPVASNIVHYARIVRDKAVLRRLIEKASEIASFCFEESGEVEDILEAAESSIFEISQSKITRSFSPIKGILGQSIRTITSLCERKELVTGVPSGYTELDRMTAGFQPSDLIIIAGRPSMGKTALALNIAQNAAISHKTPVAIFSLEMSKEQLALRMLCSEAQVDMQHVRTGFVSDHDWPRLYNAANLLSEAPIYIDDTPAQSVLDMRAKARRLKSESNSLGLVIVDYLQLMKGRGRTESREQEISEISRSLKAMAKELHVPVIALSQLNRKVEDRPHKRPQMSDLRESGAIEQDADVIAFIYRDEVYNRAEDNPNKGIAEIIVGKQRNGPTGIVRLAFVSRYSTFGNLEKDRDAS